MKSKLKFPNGSSVWLSEDTAENMEIIVRFLEYRLKKDKKRRGYMYTEVRYLTQMGEYAMKTAIEYLDRLGYVKKRAGLYENKYGRNKYCVRIYLLKNLENKKFNAASH